MVVKIKGWDLTINKSKGEITLTQGTKKITFILQKSGVIELKL